MFMVQNASPRVMRSTKIEDRPGADQCHLGDIFVWEPAPGFTTTYVVVGFNWCEMVVVGFNWCEMQPEVIALKKRLADAEAMIVRLSQGAPRDELRFDIEDPDEI